MTAALAPNAAIACTSRGIEAGDAAAGESAAIAADLPFRPDLPH
jgi:hypothetical protein